LLYSPELNIEKTKHSKSQKLPNRTLNMSILNIPLIAKHVIFLNIRLKFIGSKGWYQWKSENQPKNKRENPFRRTVGREIIRLPRSEFLLGLNRILPKPAFLFDGFLRMFLSDETRNTIYGKARGVPVSWASVSLHPFPCPRVCLFTRSCYAELGVGQARTRDDLLIRFFFHLGVGVGWVRPDFGLFPYLTRTQRVWKIQLATLAK
jgi:hypothetical protein